MQSNEIKPGPDLYIQVRQGFVGQGSSLNRWCIENDIKRCNAVACIKGMWNGPKGTALRKRIVQAAAITDTSSPVAKAG